MRFNNTRRHVRERYVNAGIAGSTVPLPGFVSSLPLAKFVENEPGWHSHSDRPPAICTLLSFSDLLRVPSTRSPQLHRTTSVPAENENCLDLKGLILPGGVGID